VWKPALEKYAAVSHLTVALYDEQGRLVCGPINESGMFAFFSRYQYDPGLFADCVNRCLHETGAGPAVVVADRAGLAAVGAPLVLNGATVGVAVAGYNLVEFPQSIPIERLAREGGFPFRLFWDVVRGEAPLSRRRLVVQGELLQVLGDALLVENYRTRQYEETSVQLRAASGAKDRFLAMISHEFRTPLTAVLGWTKVLRTRHLDEARRLRALDTIERNAEAQVTMIEELLDVSRAVAGTTQLDQHAVLLGPIIARTVDTLTPAADSRDILLDVRIEEMNGTVEGDSDRLQQVVLNLIGNAIKFTAPGGEVRIRLARRDSKAELSVSDSGQGISPDVLPHIFEAFIQADGSTARRQGGLGLGLAIAHHFITMHGGTIRAESAGEGQGATFTVTLPLTVSVGSPAQRLSTEGVDLSALSSSPSLVHGVRVLVVEDEVDTRDLIRVVLEEAGARVTGVGSVREAETELERTLPDVLVSDIALPAGEDGYTLIKRLRLRPPDQGGEIPAIAVTAHCRASDRARAMASGYQMFLHKPVDTSELTGAVGFLASVRKEPEGKKSG
jgi:signal transduction histidine kinase/CheY-like chemotaxis protein